MIYQRRRPQSVILSRELGEGKGIVFSGGLALPGMDFDASAARFTLLSSRLHRAGDKDEPGGGRMTGKNQETSEENLLSSAPIPVVT